MRPIARRAMNSNRRKVLQWTAGAAASLWQPSRPWAQTYPTRPLRWIIGFPAGGAADVVSRILATWLSDRLGQSVIVENRPGAGTNVATHALLQLPPDGHTLLLIGSSTVVNALLHEGLRSRLLRDIVPVAGLTASAFAILANSAVPLANLADLIAYAKATPGALRVGSYGIGTQSHLAAELLKLRTGIDVTHVPYRGGAPLISDLLGKHIDAGFDTVANALSHIRSGALRALAVTTSARLIDTLPEIPAVAETVPGYEATVWTGIGVRSGTPPEIVERLHRELNAGLTDPAIKARIEDLAITPTLYSPEKFAAFWAAETDRTLTLIQALNIQLE